MKSLGDLTYEIINIDGLFCLLPKYKKILPLNDSSVT